MSLLSALRTWRSPAAVAAGVVMALAAGAVVAAPAQAAPVAGTSYHVQCGRSANGDGSAGNPWNSLGPVNRHPAFTAGDQILLKRGTTCTGRLHPLGEGAAGSPIILGAYGSGAKPTVNGGGTGDQTGTVQLLNQSYWTIQDLHVTNTGKAKETSNYRSGVFIRGFDGRQAGITLQRLTVDHVTSNLSYKKNDPREFGGITAQTLGDGKPGSGFDGLQILNNRVSGVGRTGILVSNHGYPKTSDKRTRIAYNTITRARGDSILIRGATNARIDHNVSAYGANFWPCAQCGGVSPQTANAGIWPAYSKNTLIEYNEVYGEHEPGGDGEGIDVDISAVSTVVQYNSIHDNEGGGVLFCGSNKTTVRFNILENNQQGAFTFIGSIPASNTTIYNNTVYSKRGNKALVVRTFAGQKGKSVSFFNNLIYNMDDSGYYVWPTNPKSRTNIFVGVHGIAEPRGYAEEFSDPGLRNPGSGGIGFKTLNGYRPTSPKNDTPGTAIPKSVTKDFFGNTINPKKPPRGAASK